MLGPEAERELGKWCCSGDGRGLQAARPARGPRGDRAGGGCSSAHAGLRQLTSAACGAAGAAAWAALARLRPARTPRPQLRVQRSPAVFVQLRSSPAARPPGRGPRLESPPEPSQPGYQRLGTAAAAPARARNVVTAGTRWRHGPGRRDERLASCENLEPASLLVPACGALCRRGDFAGTDLRRWGVVGAGNWGRCWRGLGWSSERAGRTTSVEPPHPARWCTSDLSSGSPAPARPRPWPGAGFHGACRELWSPGSSGPCIWRALWS